MGSTNTLPLRRIGWLDITVENADALRDFYAAAVGWKPQPLDMGGYSDYVVAEPESGDGIAGVCHARGMNAELPPVWIPYFTVPDLEASLAAVKRLGGNLVQEPRKMGESRYAVIRDPAGAVCALYQP